MHRETVAVDFNKGNCKNKRTKICSSIEVTIHYSKGGQLFMLFIVLFIYHGISYCYIVDGRDFLFFFRISSKKFANNDLMLVEMWYLSSRLWIFASTAIWSRKISLEDRKESFKLRLRKFKFKIPFTV